MLNLYTFHKWLPFFEQVLYASDAHEVNNIMLCSRVEIMKWQENHVESKHCYLCIENCSPIWSLQQHNYANYIMSTQSGTNYDYYQDEPRSILIPGPPLCYSCNLVMMSFHPCKICGDARYVSEDPFNQCHSKESHSNLHKAHVLWHQMQLLSCLVDLFPCWNIDFFRAHLSPLLQSVSSLPSIAFKHSLSNLSNSHCSSFKCALKFGIKMFVALSLQ